MATAETSKILGIFAIIKDADLSTMPDLFAALLSGNWRYRLSDSTGKVLKTWAEKELAPHNPLCARLVQCMIANAAANRLGNKQTYAACADAYYALLSHPAFPSGVAVAVLPAMLAQWDKVCADPRIAERLVALMEKTEFSNSMRISGMAGLLGDLDAADFTPGQAAILATKVYPSIIRANDGLANGSRYQELGRRLMPSWLALAGRSGDRNAITAVVTANREAMAGNFAHVTRLTLEGLPELAASLVAPLHEPFLLESCYLYGGGNEGTVVFHYDKKLEAALPALLGAIKDPQQRYRIECLMNIYHETNDKSGLPSVSRDDRIAKLSARYQAEVPAQQQARLEILCAIAPGKDDALANAHRAICAGLQMGDLVADAYRLRQRQPDPVELQRIHYRICALDRLIHIGLSNGDPTEFFKQCKGLTACTGDEKKVLPQDLCGC